MIPWCDVCRLVRIVSVSIAEIVVGGVTGAVSRMISDLMINKMFTTPWKQQKISDVYYFCCMMWRLSQEHRVIGMRILELTHNTLHMISNLDKIYVVDEQDGEAVHQVLSIPCNQTGGICWRLALAVSLQTCLATDFVSLVRRPEFWDADVDESLAQNTDEVVHIRHFGWAWFSSGCTQDLDICAAHPSFNALQNDENSCVDEAWSRLSNVALKSACLIDLISALRRRPELLTCPGMEGEESEQVIKKLVLTWPTFSKLTRFDKEQRPIDS